MAINKYDNEFLHLNDNRIVKVSKAIYQLEVTSIISKQIGPDLALKHYNTIRQLATDSWRKDIPISKASSKILSDVFKCAISTEELFSSTSVNNEVPLKHLKISSEHKLLNERKEAKMQNLTDITSKELSKLLNKNKEVSENELKKHLESYARQIKELFTS